MKEALLVTLADERYVQQAKQLFSGAYWNAGWKGDYMLLSHGIPERELAWFRRKGIRVKKCRPVFREDEVRKRSISVFSKLYLFTPEFRKWKNIVFLDADMIVRASLDGPAAVKGFHAVNGGRLGILVVKPDRLSSGSENAAAKRRREEVAEAYDLEKEGFNSGMMAFSTDVIKKDTFSTLRRLALTYNEANRYGDQLILNLMFYGRYVPLPLVYNCQPTQLSHIYNMKPEAFDGALLHFVGRKKPWLVESPFFSEWSANLARADTIDLSRIPAPRRAFSEEEVADYRRHLEMRRILYMPRHAILHEVLPFIGGAFRRLKEKLGGGAA